MIEIWKDIKDFEGLYQISNFGRVKSLARNKVCGKTMRNVVPKKEILLKQIKRGVPLYQKYVYVHLSKNGKIEDKVVHRLVANAFISNPENKPFVNHINGIKADNRIENLEWVTRSENELHAFRIGLKISKKGEDVYNAKKTNYEIRKIKILHKLNMMQRDIANVMGIDFREVNSIIKGRRWNHICI